MIDEINKKPDKVVPKELRRFNFGALMVPVPWAFDHNLGLWGLIFLLLLPFHCGFIMVIHHFESFLNADFYYETNFFLIVLILEMVRFGFALYMGFNGNRMAWDKGKYESLQLFQKKQMDWSIRGVTLPVLLTLVLLAASTLLPVPEQGFAFRECREELRNISSGLQEEIGENGNLTHVRTAGDVCNHILPGYDTPDECRKDFPTHVDFYCKPGSFEFNKLNNYKYELNAVSNGKLKQEICVTEAGVRPEKYGKKRRPAACIHN